MPLWGETASSLAALWDEEWCHEGHGLTRLRAARVGSKEVQVRGKEGGGRMPGEGKGRNALPCLEEGRKKELIFL